MHSKNVVLITGASSGFGYNTTLELIQRGCTVYAAARRMERMGPLRDVGATILSMDVTNHVSVNEGIATIIEQEGQLDVLVNNAGYGGYGMLECVSLDEAHRQFEVNVFGALRVIRAVLPHMRAQGGGRIINVSSVVGIAAMPMVGWYSASKHALESLTDTLRCEMRRFGIFCSLIEPGPVKTGFSDVALKQLAMVEHDEAYRTSVENFKKKFNKMYAAAPPADRVVKAIVNAVFTRKPKTRYRLGVAGVIHALKKVAGDRLMDALWRRVYGIK